MRALRANVFGVSIKGSRRKPGSLLSRISSMRRARASFLGPTRHEAGVPASTKTPKSGTVAGLPPC